MSEVTEIISTGSRHKSRSGHLRSPCPFHHSWQHLLPPPASILEPDLRLQPSFSPGHFQVLAHLWVLALEAALLLSLCISGPLQLGSQKGKGQCAPGTRGSASRFFAPPPFTLSWDPEVPSPTHPPAPSTQPTPEHHLTSWYSPPGRKLTLLLSAKRASRAPTYTVLPSLLSRRAV